MADDTDSDSSSEESGDDIRQFHTAFPRFPQLPIELQIKIWRLAAPCHRSFAQYGLSAGVVIVALDLDLNNLRGILPSTRELKRAYLLANYGTSAEVHSILTDSPVWGFPDDTMRNLRRPIMWLLHTCRSSRIAVHDLYRLDFNSIIENEMPPLWSEQDIVYFYAFKKQKEENALVYWMSQQQRTYPTTFNTLQHLALHLDSQTALFLGLYPPVVRSINWEEKPKFQNQWLSRFPSLQSMIFFLDPLNQLKLIDDDHTDGGTILLYEPIDVSVVGFGGGWRPSQLVRKMTEILESVTPDNAEAPLVEIFTCGLRKPRNRKTIKN
ncbi:hypothetical protein F5884DRAFT_854479 [Xylogone sp. PMI_703]|nr:hypothetical protein F5884DRAFT_854479 [Xylogone sp. PMI_703]